MPLVSVVMGSRSDDPLMEPTVEVLDQMGIEHEVLVISAHRTPERLQEFGQSARDRGVEAIIAGSGGSTGLPRELASWTTLPISGVPLPTSDPQGIAALYAIAQMPPSIPVACLAVGSWGPETQLTSPPISWGSGTRTSATPTARASRAVDSTLFGPSNGHVTRTEGP